MTFRVQRPHGTGPQLPEYGNDVTYEFEEDGVLKISQAREITYYAPNAWESVSSRDGHRPGDSGRPGYKAARPMIGHDDGFDPMTAQF